MQKAGALTGISLLLLFLIFHGLIFGKVYQSGDAQSVSSIGEALSGEWFVQWNPYIFCGMPAWASLQYCRGAYPLEWPFMLTGIPMQYLHLLHYLIAALGFYAFLGHWLGKESMYAKIFGAISFAFSLQMIGLEVFGHGSKMMTAAWIPWVMYFAKIREAHSVLDKKRLAGLALVLGLQILRGHFQIVYYTWMLLGAYLVWQYFLIRKDVRGKYLIGNGIALALAIVVGGVLLFPTMTYTGESTRGIALASEYAESWSLHPKELTTLVMPFFYGFGGEKYTGFMIFSGFPFFLGVSVFVMAVVGAVGAWKSKYVKFFIAVLVFTVLVSMGKYTPFNGFLRDVLPYYSRFRVPSMIMIVGQFSLSVLATIGFSSFILNQKKLKYLTLICIVVASVMIYIDWHQSDIALFSGTCAALFGIGLIKDQKIRSKAWIGLFAVEILIVSSWLPDAKEKPIKQGDALVQTLKQDSSVYRVLFTPPFAQSNYYAQYGIEAVTGYSPVKPQIMQNMIEKTDSFRKFNGMNNFVQVLRHFNVKYIVSGDSTILSEDFRRVDTWTWYQGRRTRVFIYVNPYHIARAHTLRLRPLSYERTGLESFEIRHDGIDTVFVSERYDPNWKTSSGRIEQNGVMMRVIGADNEFKVKYEPTVFKWSAYGSFFVFCCLVGYLTKEKKLFTFKKAKEVIETFRKEKE